MPQYAFGEYRFDAETLQLWKNKSRTRLRPKAAELLALFILHKGHVLSKTTIAQAIWKQEHVPDHTLFQLISELRKLSPSMIIVGSHPLRLLKSTHTARPFWHCARQRALSA
ncbi:winged helix-turn-helix domain-containing protein [Marinagarivorans cellulosilyticus]|uniref:OmpR/PhoB-type domain-containing protein n=1 Tax=Marinagarivorans cellulosilyticus TaxID=2721545 RepID=A0AAN1WIV3_9GAMM|nr:winged helix-turn-helix domain-containing protein [Marinagarivorans cellulosilyticus]BCD98453.1 hypothetical protein MARGE09_P2654 [Marinagarivorans cellulosilyticus]